MINLLISGVQNESDQTETSEGATVILSVLLEK